LKYAFIWAFIYNYLVAPIKFTTIILTTLRDNKVKHTNLLSSTWGGRCILHI